ncbi:MAG: NAD(P)-dependent glycerol-3-phosphate dehydrogenase [Elusimicrobia bacterium]|nr:NAD(P)-dependent glycerol-3-phosphate dehydrogenase [Elusimicrobiota bacterium]
MFGKITILGGGCWGAAVADLLSGRADITLWEWDRARSEYLKKKRHPRFFPYLKLEKKVGITNDLEKVFPADLILAAVPAQSFRAVLKRLRDRVKSGEIPVLVLSKGIEISTLKTLDSVCMEVLGKSHPVAVLSGPSHAEEVCLKHPTTVVIAGEKKLAVRVQKLFHFPFFRPYVRRDIRGVAAAGALKNVIAIAAGICDGLGLGINAKAALVTRGLAEITRIGVALGGKRETFSGLAGIGDLMVTCFSNYSRNRNLGEEIGRGLKLNQARKKVKTLTEGAETVKAVKKLIGKKKISAPITCEVYGILYRGLSPKRAISNLMKRPVKSEEEG